MLERVWQENHRILRCLVGSVLSDQSRIDDVLQEAFARILRAERQFQSQREAFVYVRRIVLNTAIDYYRHLQRWQQLPLKETSQDSLYPAKEPDPLDILIKEEQQSLQRSVLSEIRQALDLLPEDQREAIELIFNRGDQSVKDLCREIGIPYSTLRSRMLTGIDRIRKRLRARGIYQGFVEDKKR